MNKAIVLEGGGVLGTAYAGAYRYLQKNGFEFNYFVGSSIGSAFAAAMACRIDAMKLRDMVLEKDFGEFAKNALGFLSGVPRLIFDYGWYTNKVFQDWVEEILETATGRKLTTFADIARDYDNTLCVTAYSTEQGKNVYFNMDTTPDLPVSVAVGRSTAMPFVYSMVKGEQPESNKKDWYIDGGVVDNFPIAWAKERCDDVFGLKLIKNNYIIPIGRPTNIVNYAELIIALLREANMRKHIAEEDWEKTVKINVNGFSTIEFAIDREQKVTLMQRGYHAVQQYFEHIDLERILHN